MDNPLEINAKRYQADEGYVYAEDPGLRKDQRRLAAFIGTAAMGMPAVLAIGGTILSRYDLGKFRQSLSGFYYEEVLLGDIFVGTLIFIGTAMFIYRGWNPKVARLGSIGGVCAVLVALFPADGWFLVRGGDPIFEFWSDRIHLFAAGALFAILAWFCFFVFTKVEEHQLDENGEVLPSKRQRDRLYRFCGTVIVLAIAASSVGHIVDVESATRLRLTYWGETVGLVAFGISWMVQGRVFGTLLQDPRDRTDEVRAGTQES